MKIPFNISNFTLISNQTFHHYPTHIINYSWANHIPYIHSSPIFGDSIWLNLIKQFHIYLTFIFDSIPLKSHFWWFTPIEIFHGHPVRTTLGVLRPLGGSATSLDCPDEAGRFADPGGQRTTGGAGSNLMSGTGWKNYGLYGLFIWDYMGLPGIIWDYMGLYGIIWD